MSELIFATKSPVSLIHGLLEFSFKIKPSQIIGIIGTNGVGKSTFFQLIKMNQNKYFPGIQLSFLEQRPLCPLGDLRGIDLLEMICDCFPERSVYKSVQDNSLVEKWNFKDLLARPISSYSGGENQMLKLIATFSINAQVYFLDEPTNHLDEKKKLLLEEHLLSLKNTGKIVFMIDHHLNFMQHFCDQVYEMKKNNSQLLQFILSQGDYGP